MDAFADRVPQPAGVLGETGLRSPALAGAARAAVALYPLLPYIRPGRPLAFAGTEPTAPNLVGADDCGLVRRAFERLHEIYDYLPPPTAGVLAVSGLGELDMPACALDGICALLLAAVPSVLAQAAPNLRLSPLGDPALAAETVMPPALTLAAPPSLELRRALEHAVGEYLRLLTDDLVIEQRPVNRPRCQTCLYRQPPLLTSIRRSDGAFVEYITCEACNACSRVGAVDGRRRRPRRAALYAAVERMAPYVLPHIAESIRAAAPIEPACRVSGGSVGDRLALKRMVDEQDAAILSATARTAVDLVRHLHQSILALPVARHLLPPLPSEDAIRALVRAAERTA